MSSENRVFLLKAVPQLVAQAKAVLAKNSLFVYLEGVKIGDSDGKSLDIALNGKTFSCFPRKVETFDLHKFNSSTDDREEVAFPMETFQKFLGNGAKLEAFSTEDSSTLVLMVDKNFDEVTSEENLMGCVFTLLGELCDTETGKIAQMKSLRLPLVLSGGFILTAKGSDGMMQVDLYNEDQAHVGAIEGIQLAF